MKDYVKGRLQEASTWHGVFWCLAAFGIYQFSDEQVQAVTALATVLAGGGSSIVVPDRMLKKLTKSK